MCGGEGIVLHRRVVALSEVKLEVLLRLHLIHHLGGDLLVPLHQLPQRVSLQVETVLDIEVLAEGEALEIDDPHPTPQLRTHLLLRHYTGGAEDHPQTGQVHIDPVEVIAPPGVLVDLIHQEDPTPLVLIKLPGKVVERVTGEVEVIHRHVLDLLGTGGDVTDRIGEQEDRLANAARSAHSHETIRRRDAADQGLTIALLMGSQHPVVYLPKALHAKSVVTGTPIK